jgi:hypothetical protein
MRKRLKYAAFSFDYNLVTVMEPTGIPLKEMDKLFHIYNKSVTDKYGLTSAWEQTNFILPRASALESNYLSKILPKNSPPCKFRIRKNIYFLNG